MLTISYFISVSDPRILVVFISCFLAFVFSIILKKWDYLYVALPGMFFSALALAYQFLGGS